jgi:hypothetical protein
MRVVKDLVLASRRYDHFCQLFGIGGHGKISGEYLAQQQGQVFLFLLFKSYIGSGNDIGAANAKIGQVVATVFTRGGSVMSSCGDMNGKNCRSRKPGFAIGDHPLDLGGRLLGKGVEHRKNSDCQ